MRVPFGPAAEIGEQEESSRCWDVHLRFKPDAEALILLQSVQPHLGTQTTLITSTTLALDTVRSEEEKHTHVFLLRTQNPGVSGRQRLQRKHVVVAQIHLSAVQ